jgi:hypothetical protein
MRLVEREWKYLGFKCLVALDQEFFEEWFSGYVAVAKGHPYWGKEQNQVKVDVHGGLTFSKRGTVDKDLWWFGFHCAHGNDDTRRGDWDFERKHPIVQSQTPLHKWTIDEVCAETERLANQLANASKS